MYLSLLQLEGEKISAADPAFTELSPGDGPRHIAVDTEREVAHVVCELDAIIVSYKINPKTGALKKFNTTKLLEFSSIPVEKQKWTENFPGDF